MGHVLLISYPMGLAPDATLVNTQVTWLLSVDACDPSARTAKGETALHLSAIRGDERMCETLINGACPAEAVTLEGKTALHLAAEMGETRRDREGDVYVCREKQKGWGST